MHPHEKNNHHVKIHQFLTLACWCAGYGLGISANYTQLLTYFFSKDHEG